MADVLATGKAVLTEWVSKLPEADRAAVQAIINKADAQAAVQFIGESALRQPDYSRAMNELQERTAREDAYRQELETWGATHKQELEDLRTYKAAYPEPTPGKEPVVIPVPDPAHPAPIQTPAAAPHASSDDLVKQWRAEMDQREQDYAAFLAESGPLQIQHFQQFGEVLDIRKLMQHPEIAKAGLKGVYSIVFADQLRAKADAAKALEVQKIKDEAKAEVRQEFLAQGAVVFPPPSEGGSPLDSMGKPPVEGAPKIDLATAAAQMYNAEVAKAGVG